MIHADREAKYRDLRHYSGEYMQRPIRYIMLTSRNMAFRPIFRAQNYAQPPLLNDPTVEKI